MLPYTEDPKKNKFDPKTIPCVFVGYKDKYKGYKCFKTTSRNFFMSHHVVFDEMMFLYKESRSNKKTPRNSRTMSVFDSWLP